MFFKIIQYRYKGVFMEKLYAKFCFLKAVYLPILLSIMMNLSLLNCENISETVFSLKAEAVSSSQINLTWEDNSSEEDGFRLERKTGSGEYTEISIIPSNETSFNDTGLDADTIYFYRIRAFNNNGISNYSDEVSAMTDKLISSTFIIDHKIIDHNCTDITQIPEEAINKIKNTLHIAYAHTSHGSQLTTGMTGMIQFINNGGLGLSLPYNIFKWNNGGTDGALDFLDYFTNGDLGNPDRTTWAKRTRKYLNSPANSNVNVVMWSWCGQADTTKENIDLYLSLMTQLEEEYPEVNFIYMTGHANGTGENGNLHLRNQQIRRYCEKNNKILFDFYDIECYNPDGEYFGDKLVNDNCDYDTDGNGTGDGNWAIEWQNSHINGVDWYNCSSAHSQSLNANRKAYAVWWMLASIAGWKE